MVWRKPDISQSPKALPYTYCWRTQTYYRKQSAYIGIQIYVITISAVRISILCLYRRVFTTSSFRRATTVLGATSVAWLFAAGIASINTCMPIERFWNNKISGHCLNFDKIFLGITLAEILLNVAILCLPLPVISALQLPLRHKIPLFVTFLIGGL